MKCGHRLRRLFAIGRFRLTMKSDILRRGAALIVALAMAVLMLSSCGMINPGKFKWIVKTDPDEKYWLVKNVCVSPGSSYVSKKEFNHNMNPVVNVLFTPQNEKNHYVAKTVWIDPLGQEFRTIRTTHDIQREGKKSIDRRPINDGTPRMQTMPTKLLYDHKPGLWKVELYIDGELARKLEFTVR